MNLKCVSREYHPDAPTQAELSKIKPGSAVRLELDSGTFFWCLVTEPRRAGGIFKGVADDTAPPVRRGDTVYFSVEHVFIVL